MKAVPHLGHVMKAPVIFCRYSVLRLPWLSVLRPKILAANLEGPEALRSCQPSPNHGQSAGAGPLLAAHEHQRVADLSFLNVQDGHVLSDVLSELVDRDLP